MTRPDPHSRNTPEKSMHRIQPFVLLAAALLATNVHAREPGTFDDAAFRRSGVERPATNEALRTFRRAVDPARSVRPPLPTSR
jgi:hypothetical protein